MKISKIRLFLWTRLVILLRGSTGGVRQFSFPLRLLVFEKTNFLQKFGFGCEKSKKVHVFGRFLKAKPNFVVDNIEFVFKFEPILHVFGI